MTTQKTKATGGRLIAFLCLIGCATGAYGNELLFGAADRAAGEGRHKEMQQAYEQILRAEPDNVRALNGKATAEAWQGKYTASQATFLRALSADPKNLDSLVGIGYAYAWAGQYPHAHNYFQRALQVEIRSLSARKGIAYAYHWAGDHGLALDALETARTLAPDDPEIAELAARANLSLGHSRDAVVHFDEALRLDPERHSARLGKRSAYTAAPALEVHSRVGSTSNGGSGLRGIEFAHWPSAATRLSLRYDNTLGLDNASINDRGEEAPGYFAKVNHQLTERWGLQVEAGRLELDSGDTDLFGLQSSVATAWGVVHLGTQIGRRDLGGNDTLVYGGVNFPLGWRWRLEPTIYVSESGAADDTEWRGVVHAEYQTGSSWQAGGFIGGGEIDATDAALGGSTLVAGTWGRWLLADRYALQLTLRREQLPSANFTVVELGFTYRLPRN